MEIHLSLMADDRHEEEVEHGQIIYTADGTVVGQFDGHRPDANGVPDVAIIAPGGALCTYDLGEVGNWTLIPPSQGEGTTPRMLQLRASIAGCMKVRGYSMPKPLADFVMAALGSESIELLAAANAALMDKEIPF